MRRALALHVLLAASLAVPATGCSKIEAWINKKADEKIAEEIDSVADEVDDQSDGKPSGVSSKKKKKKKSAGADTDQPANPVPVVPQPGLPPGIPAPMPPKSSVDFLADAKPLPGLYKAQAPAGAKAIEVLIYPTYGHAQFDDGKEPGKVLEVEMRDGLFEATHVKPMPPRDAAELKKAAFDLDEADFSAIPAMVKDAPGKCDLPNATTSYIILERELPFSSHLLFRVYVQGGMRAAIYDAKGKWVKSI